MWVLNKTFFNKLRLRLIRDPEKRGEFLADHINFKEVGKNLYYYPKYLPNKPELIRIKNNVTIAANVTFVEHDMMKIVFNNIEPESTHIGLGCIEIGNNVFIGANATILPNVKIGDNCIIGSGSILTKNIEKGSVVAGVPAKRVNSFEKIFNERKKEYLETKGLSVKQRVDRLWSEFDEVDRPI